MSTITTQRPYVSVNRELDLYRGMTRADKDLYYFLRDLTPSRFLTIGKTWIPYGSREPMGERIYSRTRQYEMMRQEGYLYLTFVDHSKDSEKPMVLALSVDFFRNPPSQTAQKVDLVERLIQHKPCGSIQVKTELSLPVLNYVLEESTERTQPDGKSVVEMTNRVFRDYEPPFVGTLD